MPCDHKDSQAHAVAMQDTVFRDAENFDFHPGYLDLILTKYSCLTKYNM